MNNITRITWCLNDYCSYQCDYCPTAFRGGGEPPETREYIRVASIINENYKALNRTIEWTIDGGEPLDMNDIVTVLRTCKSLDNTVTLHTNGGKLWMDWWAIEPYVDSLHLTYHYWQNVKLVNYIIEIFQKKSKHFTVKVPMRPSHFDIDLDRALDIERRYNLIVEKQALYKHASKDAGMWDYTKEQAAIMSGLKIESIEVKEISDPEINNATLVKEQKYFEETTWFERYEDKMNTNPVYTGKLCNMGIESLYIGHLGWVSGAVCNNRPLGNIWHEGWTPPNSPHRCGMRVCSDPNDQKITKFD